MSYACVFMRVTILVTLCFPSLSSASDPLRVVELRDGTALVGEIVDQSDKGILIRLRDGSIRNVSLTQISGVSLLDSDGNAALRTSPSDSGQPSSIGDDRLSFDGYRFPSVGARREYDSRRVVIEILDTRTGTWQADKSGAQSGITFDAGQIMSGVIGQVTGINPGISAPIGTSSEAGRTTQTYTESVTRQYRLSTGDGVPLTDFRGYLAQAPEAFFHYIDQEGVLRTHGHWTEGLPAEEYDRALRRKRQLWRPLAWVGGGIVVAGGITCASAYEPPPRNPFVGAWDDTPLSIGISTIAVGTVLPVASAIIIGKAKHAKVRQYVLDDWTIQDIAPFVRAWNTSLKENLGGT